MPSRRMMAKRPINSVKHIVDNSSVIAATTNTALLSVAVGVPAYALADTDGVPVGSMVSSIFLEIFFYAEGGEVANEVPLVDWYIIKDPNGVYGVTFDTTHLPTPGATGLHANKSKILHEEKGLAGGGDASLAGVPMVFKGVIRIPRGMRRFGQADVLLIAGRANFATKFCAKAVYKHYV